MREVETLKEKSREEGKCTMITTNFQQDFIVVINVLVQTLSNDARSKDDSLVACGFTAHLIYEI